MGQGALEGTVECRRCCRRRHRREKVQMEPEQQNSFFDLLLRLKFRPKKIQNCPNILELYNALILS